jgi:CubicO group peptidase (beta-lactamase class C family)
MRRTHRENAPMPRLAALLVALALLGASLRPPAAQPATPAASLPASPVAATPGATPVAAASLAGVMPQSLVGQRRADFEAYVAAKVAEYGVPGAAVAVVQGGEVVYAQGFGVRVADGTAPVTPDTLMMIGSVTKSMTSMMAATLVDEGRLTWETPLRDLLPAFAVAEPALTERLTLADAFCMCTGVPRRDFEFMFNSASLTPDALIASLARLPITAPYGEQYQYSNQLYAVGGYAAAAAAVTPPTDLGAAYRSAMRDRVLGPIGMPRSSFELDSVLASGDYAELHGVDFAGRAIPVALEDEASFVGAVAPAGALWSSANEMARYLQTELARGVAPDGTRVVSAANLERTWQPSVAIPPLPNAPLAAPAVFAAYGLGWTTGTYHGLPLLHHSGGTFGFVSQVVMAPQADFGVVVLTNGLTGGFLTQAVPFRLLELLYDQPPAVDAAVAGVVAALSGQFAQLEAGLVPVDPAAVTPFLGRFVHPALGEIALDLRDGRLFFDAGEVDSELLGLRDPATGAVVAYLFTDPELLVTQAVVTFQQGAGGAPEVVLTASGEAAETYVFGALDAPTPP